MHISDRLCPKVLKICTQASLDITIMWTKFQVTIQKYGFIDKLGPTRESSLKVQYLNPDTLRTVYILNLLVWRWERSIDSNVDNLLNLQYAIFYC
jgi:hypothetical protein